MVRATLALLLAVLATCALADVWLAPTDARLLFEGRWGGFNATPWDPNSAYCGWSGCTFTFTVSGATAVILDIEGNQHGVFVDGVQSTVIRTSGNTTVPLANTNKHVIKVIRRTEANQWSSALKGVGAVGANAAVTTTAAPTRHMEFIGDSITCGYGNEGKFPCSFTADTENAALSWAYILADVFGAEVSFVTWSGKGLLRNYNEPSTRSKDPLPNFYNLSLGYQSSGPFWPVGKSQADVVVINLGTNDYSTEPSPTAADFTAAYISFVKNTVSRYNPTAKFFFACGPMIDGTCCTAVKAAVAGVQGATYIDLTGLIKNDEDKGCDWHPSVLCHQKMSKVAQPIIAKVMGW